MNPLEAVFLYSAYNNNVKELPGSRLEWGIKFELPMVNKIGADSPTILVIQKKRVFLIFFNV